MDMKIKALNDRLTLWILFGISGSILREITGLILVLTHLIKVHIVNLAADLFTNNLGEIRSVFGIVIGMLADWVLGAAIGIFIGLLFQWTGHKNYLLKGIGVGLIAWIGIFGFLVHGMPQMFVIKPEALRVSGLSVLAHCVFGGTTAMLINKYVPTKTNQWSN